MQEEVSGSNQGDWGGGLWSIHSCSHTSHNNCWALRSRLCKRTAVINHRRREERASLWHVTAANMAVWDSRGVGGKKNPKKRIYFFNFLSRKPVSPGTSMAARLFWLFGLHILISLDEGQLSDSAGYSQRGLREQIEPRKIKFMSLRRLVRCTTLYDFSVAE